MQSHERNSSHLLHYCNWKHLEASLKKHTGIDASLQKELETETAKWRQILRCILHVTLFLAERNLPFRGHNSKIGDQGNGLFLGELELLSRYNPVLKLHLNEVKQSQDKSQTRMQAHYLSWGSQNEFIELCGKLVFDAVVKEVKDSLYYSIIVDGTPDASHTEQITFVLRYVLYDGNTGTWEVKERFLMFKDCEKAI